MTNADSPEEMSAQREAVQAVVDRVSAWQQTATEGVVLEELRNGLAEAQVQLDEDVVQRLAEAIESADGPVDAADSIR